MTTNERKKKQAEYSRLHYLKNKEKRLKEGKKWREENRERFNELVRNHYWRGKVKTMLTTTEEEMRDLELLWEKDEISDYDYQSQMGELEERYQFLCDERDRYADIRG